MSALINQLPCLPRNFVLGNLFILRNECLRMQVKLSWFFTDHGAARVQNSMGILLVHSTSVHTRGIGIRPDWARATSRRMHRDKKTANHNAYRFEFNYIEGNNDRKN